MKKTAIILFNLGGPTSKQAIRPFLINFFMDPNIIRAPKFVRFFLSRFIAYKRSKKEAGQSYGFLGDESPLLGNTILQQQALQDRLSKDDKNTEFKVFTVMRYWHPMADSVALDVKNYNPDDIVLLPLYPQFSTTTTKSSYEAWQRACALHNLKKPETFICCYPFDGGFIKASCERIVKKLKKIKPEQLKNWRLLFSAHGLPEKIIKDGDPYQYQCEKTAEKIAQQLGKDYGYKNLDWQICYQSRVGPLKWIGPSTEAALEQAAKDKKNVMIYPLAFVSEHVETLVEIEIEYREIAEELGIHNFERVETVGTHTDFIKGLAQIILQRKNKYEITDNRGGCVCPEKFAQCCQRLFCSKKKAA